MSPKKAEELSWEFSFLFQQFHNKLKLRKYFQKLSRERKYVTLIFGLKKSVDLGIYFINNKP